MDKKAITPGRQYYVLSGLVFLIGCVLFVVLLVKNLAGLSDTLVQVVVPGERELTLAEPGTHIVFHEYQSVIGNKAYSTKELSGLECNLSSLETGKDITLSPTATDSTYNIGARAGRAVWVFGIDTPGKYRFSARYKEGQEGQEVVLAIGRDFAGTLIATVFGAIGILFGSIALAGVIVIITAIKREKSMKQLSSSGGADTQS